MLKLGIGLDITHKRITGGTSFDPDAQAFFNRVTAAGGSLTATEQNAVNTLVLDLKGFSLWTKMVAIYPMVGSSAAACSQNLKSASFTSTFSSGWTFASTGVTGNAISSYIDTTLSSSGNLSLNDTHISYYSRTNNSGGTKVEMGTATASTNLYIVPLYSFNDTYRAVNSAQIGPNILVSNTAALFTATRNTATEQQLYRNNTLLVNDLFVNSVALNALPIYIGCYNSSGSPLFYTNRECAFASIGNGFNSTQLSNFYTAIQAFQTSLSRQV
jgi:hypothetical protein